MVEATASQINVTEEQIEKLLEKVNSMISDPSKVSALKPEQCVGECDELLICSICFNVVTAHFVECSECSTINCYACIQQYLSKS